MKKLIYTITVAATLLPGLSSFNNNTVKADVINPTEQDESYQKNNFKKFLGKKIYNIYKSIDRKLNSQYLFHDLLISPNKIDYNYYNKYSRIRKFFGDPDQLYYKNSITMPGDIDNTPWEMNGNAPYLWSLQNGRDIYYHMNATGDTADVYNAAISAWNQLGVIRLVPTNSNSSNVIQFNNPTNLDDADGVTHYNSYPGKSNPFNVSITLDNQVDDEDYYRQLTVAEHEIGHSLGFDHDTRKLDSRTSTMNGSAEDQTYGQDYSDDFKMQNLIGAKEQHVLMQRYNLSVMDGYYEYPVVNNDFFD